MSILKVVNRERGSIMSRPRRARQESNQHSRLGACDYYDGRTAEETWNE